MISTTTATTNVSASITTATTSVIA
jgi:hypothetical protein